MDKEQKKQIYESVMSELYKIVTKRISEAFGDSDDDGSLDVQKKFWKVDLIDEENESNGSSFCVATDSDVSEDDIVDLCLENDLLDDYELQEFNIQVEDITDDDYEMDFWASEANFI